MRAQHLIVAVALFAATSGHASVEISANPTKNMNCSAGVCAPTAKNAVLNTTDLTNMLATSDVTVTTGNGAVTITVSGPFSWTSTHRLTLDAYDSVSFKAPVEVAGTGAVTIVTNDGGTGGDLLFFPGATLDFWDTSSSLIINNNVYMLVTDIATLRHRLRRKPAGYYALGKNYDASVDGTYSQSPVRASVDGIFEGLGHAIANVRIENSDTDSQNIGFISENTGTIRDLSLVNEFISALAGAHGGLVENNLGLIAHVSVDGSIQSAGLFVGGLVAYGQSGEIVDCTAAVNIQVANGGNFIGGLVGRSDGTIMNSRATGSVISTQAPSVIGGLAGQAVDVSFSYASGQVSASNNYPHGNYVGGLIGSSSGTVMQSFASGEITGGISDEIAGLAAYARTITDSYATGSVQGGDESEIGGLSVNGISASSYSTGSVMAGTKDARRTGKTYIGGFTVFGGRALNKDYWDIDTSGTTTGCGYRERHCPQVTGLSDAQLRGGLPGGFDRKIWKQKPNVNSGYPYLINNPPPQ